jgi:DNA invertase Pin-like site-specific DNA recombinase
MKAQGATAIARGLGIGRASVYRVLEAGSCISTVDETPRGNVRP